MLTIFAEFWALYLDVQFGLIRKICVHLSAKIFSSRAEKDLPT